MSTMFIVKAAQGLRQLNPAIGINSLQPAPGKITIRQAQHYLIVNKLSSTAFGFYFHLVDASSCCRLPSPLQAGHVAGCRAGGHGDTMCCGRL